jgi:hypothetical protein
MTLTRQEANLQIISKLIALVGQNPDVRFGQALVALGVLEYESDVTNDQGELVHVDMFDVESVDILAGMLIHEAAQ